MSNESCIHLGRYPKQMSAQMKSGSQVPVCMQLLSRSILPVTSSSWVRGYGLRSGLSHGTYVFRCCSCISLLGTELVTATVGGKDAKLRIFVHLSFNCRCFNPLGISYTLLEWIFLTRFQLCILRLKARYLFQRYQCRVCEHSLLRRLKILEATEEIYIYNICMYIYLNLLTLPLLQRCMEETTISE